MTTLEKQQGITTDEVCTVCGAEIVLIVDESSDGISVTCGCGSASALG
jgi:hypothetical protein